MNWFLYDDGPRHERVKKRLLYSCFPVIFTEILRANFLQNISGLCIPHNIYPVNMYLFKVNNSNTRKRCDTYLKITIKARERCHRSLSGIFFVDFEIITHPFLMLLLLTLNKQMFTSRYFPAKSVL